MSTPMTKDQIYAELSKILQEVFYIDADKINPQANLAQDLDIDSIDAVDLIVKMRVATGKRIEPEMFKTVKTIDDIVSAMEHMA